MTATTDAIARQHARAALMNGLWQASVTDPEGQPAVTLTAARSACQTLGVIPFEPVDAEDGVWLVILPDADVYALEDAGYLVLDGPHGRVDVELA